MTGLLLYIIDMTEQVQEGASLTFPNNEWQNQSDDLQHSTYQSKHAGTIRKTQYRSGRYFLFILCIIALVVVMLFVNNSTKAANKPQQSVNIHQEQKESQDWQEQIEEESKSKQTTDSQQSQPIDVDSENFNLWDLNISQKQQLLHKYNLYISSISSHKKASNQTFMNILSSKDKQAEADMKIFERQASVIEWSNSQLNQSEHQQYEKNYNKLLKERQEHIARLLQQYKSYSGSDVLLSPIKNITKSQFYQAIKYHQLTGQTNLSQSLKELSQNEKSDLQTKYQLSSYEKQLRACVIIPTFNNTHNNRFIWNLQSVLLQEYANVKVIIIDDASPDNTSQRISKHLIWRKADPNKFILIKSKQRNKSLFSFYYGAHKYCGPGEIIYTIDGDDELVGSQVFKAVNAIYQKQKPYTLYSIFIVENPRNNLTLGNNHQYPPQIKKHNTFRTDRSHAYSHLRTMLSDMFLYVNSSSFKDKNNKFYELITDNAVYFCALELSCRRVKFVEEINYWYDYNTGNNIFKKMNIKNYRAVQYDVEGKMSYRCIHDYFKDALAWIKDKQ